MISKQRKLYEKPNKRWTAVGEKNETKDKREKIIQECFCSGMRQCYNRPIPIYENSNLAARRGGIKQKKWNHLEAQYIENDLFQYSHVSLKTQWKGLHRKLKRSFFLERLWSSGLLTVFSRLKIFAPRFLWCRVHDRNPARFNVISMEFLSLSRRRSTFRKVPSGGERGGNPVFADYSFHSFGLIFEKNKKMGC